MLTKEELIDHLEDVLVDKLHFLTYIELQITSKHLDLQKMIKQDQLRIDLASIHQLDSSIYFFEAETQLHIKHPEMYRDFCDYCYLVCPDEAFDSLPSETKRQQLSWAEDSGIGIITVSKEGALRKRLGARQQSLTEEIRKEILRMMNKRFRIRFSTIPLWQRSRKNT
ncbi:MAG: hypothetical protein ACFFDT_11915 [Candidatus Hodarchaeota archaeon]